MKNFYRLILLFISIFIPVGFSSWVYNSSEETETLLDYTNDKVNINVYDVSQGTKVETTTKYSIPSSVTVNTNSFISDTDANGVSQTEKFGSIGNGYSDLTYDEKTLYYNVDSSGNKTPIYTHNINLGVEQIKSKNEHITVNSWTEVNDDTTWGDVWNVSHGTYEWYFYTNCEDSISFKSKYSVGHIIPNSIRIVSEETTYDELTNTTTNTTIYERITVRKILEQKRGRKFLFLYYVYGYYYPMVQYRRVQTIQKGGASSASLSPHIVQVTKGSTISPFELSLSNYHQYGFYSDETCTNFFDFTNPITTDTNIYLKYLEINDESSITTSINSLTSGNTLNLYNQTGGGTGSASGLNYDIFTDPYYNKENKVCFINESNIQTGATINLLYGDGNVYQSPNTGSISSSLGNHRSSTNNSINNLYSGTTYIGYENCSTYIALGGDMTINGTLNIGGHIGSNCSGTSVTRSSYIIGKYACIDLYGNNIIVDGGYLNCLGVIIDSVGTGQIIVRNGGKITGVVSISDNRAVRSSILGISKRQTLFSEYKFAYINVPIRFYNGTTFECYLKYDLTDDLGTIANFYFNIIGNSNSLFKWDDSDLNSYVDFIPYKVSNINSISLVSNLYNLRNKLVFNANIIQSLDVNLKLTISLSLGSATANVDFARIDFPISPFIDIIVKTGKYFKLVSKMTFYPGSQLYVEEGAIIKFSYYGEKSYSTMSGVPVPGETRYLAGGIMNYTNKIGDLASYGPSNERFAIGIYNNSDYWKYNKFGNIIIDGNLEFDSSINTGYSTGDGYYFISGYIDLSNNALKSIINNHNYIKTYDFKAELNNGYLFSGTDTDKNKQYLRATSYNMNPLISNGLGYIIDPSNLIKGNYINGVLQNTMNISIVNDEIEGVNNGNKYFLYTDQDMYENGSKGSNQSNRIDRTIIIKTTDWYDYDHKVIVSDNVYYCYYKGLYVPSNDDLSLISIVTNSTIVSVNLRKFMSNADVEAGYETKNIKFSTNNNWIFVS